jgi:polysaccharide export outer membrane protein
VLEGAFALSQEAIINRSVLLAVLVATSLSACSRPNYQPELASVATPQETLAAPSLADTMTDRAEYRIGPLDKLTVTVFGIDELETTAQVDSGGMFAMPLIGQVRALGETPNSFARILESELRQRDVLKPYVTVLVNEAISQQITIEGSVLRPGVYPAVGKTSLLRMLAMSGGATEFARLSEVLVFRTVEGKKLVARFNVADIRGARAQDPDIYGNDVIIVGEDKNKRLFKDAVQTAPLFGVFYQLSR